MAPSGRVQCSSRMVLARQLMVDGCFRQLMVVSRRDGQIVVAPFERETAATLFVDAPLALVCGDIADARFLETVNALKTVDSIVAYLRDSGSTEVGSCTEVKILKMEVGNCDILDI